MSDQTSTPNAPATDDKPKAKRTRSQTIPHSAAIVAFAKARNIDEVRAGKQFRAILRSNADEYRKNGGKAHTKNSAWGDHPRKALVALFPTVKAFKGS